jgi:hypothetical protein
LITKRYKVLDKKRSLQHIFVFITKIKKAEIQSYSSSI